MFILAIKCDQVGYLNVLNDEAKELTINTAEERLLETFDAEKSDNEPVAAVFDRFKPSVDNLASYQKYVTSLGSDKAGYCLMLDYAKITSEFLETCPQVFNYIEQVCLF